MNSATHLFYKKIKNKKKAKKKSSGGSSGSLLLDHGLPLALALPDGEAVDLRLDLCPPLAHVVLDVEHKGVLAKVGVHHLAGRLQAHGGVQVGLQGDRSRGHSDSGYWQGKKTAAGVKVARSGQGDRADGIDAVRGPADHNSPPPNSSPTRCVRACAWPPSRSNEQERQLLRGDAVRLWALRQHECVAGRQACSAAQWIIVVAKTLILFTERGGWGVKGGHFSKHLSAAWVRLIHAGVNGSVHSGDECFAGAAEARGRGGVAGPRAESPLAQQPYRKGKKTKRVRPWQDTGCVGLDCERQSPPLPTKHGPSFHLIPQIHISPDGRVE